MKSLLKKSLFALAVAASFAAPAQADEIRFETGFTTNWQEISPTFGSVAGPFDVTYLIRSAARTASASGPATTAAALRPSRARPMAAAPASSP